MLTIPLISFSFLHSSGHITSSLNMAFTGILLWNTCFHTVLSPVSLCFQLRRDGPPSLSLSAPSGIPARGPARGKEYWEDGRFGQHREEGGGRSRKGGKGAWQRCRKRKRIGRRRGWNPPGHTTLDEPEAPVEGKRGRGVREWQKEVLASSHRSQGIKTMSL